MWPHDAMVGGAHRTKIGLILQFLERAALQVGPDIKDPGNAATGQNLNAMLIEGSCLNDGIHNIPLRYRNGSILNTGSPTAASFQSASRSSRCISIHAWTSFIFAGGNPPPRTAPSSIATTAGQPVELSTDEPRQPADGGSHQHSHRSRREADQQRHSRAVDVAAQEVASHMRSQSGQVVRAHLHVAFEHLSRLQGVAP